MRLSLMVFASVLVATPALAADCDMHDPGLLALRHAFDDCSVQTARRLSRGPDRADDIATAAVTACHQQRTKLEAAIEGCGGWRLAKASIEAVESRVHEDAVRAAVTARASR